MLRIRIEMKTFRLPDAVKFSESLFSGTVLVGSEILDELRNTCPRRTIANSMTLDVIRQGKTIIGNIRALPLLRAEQKYRWILPVLEKEITQIVGKYTHAIVSDYLDRIEKVKM